MSVRNLLAALPWRTASYSSAFHMLLSAENLRCQSWGGFKELLASVPPWRDGCSNMFALPFFFERTGMNIFIKATSGSCNHFGSLELFASGRSSDVRFMAESDIGCIELLYCTMGFLFHTWKVADRIPYCVTMTHHDLYILLSCACWIIHPNVPSSNPTTTATTTTATGAAAVNALQHL